MAPLSQLSLLAFATSALAVPFANTPHAYGHQSLHTTKPAYTPAPPAYGEEAPPAYGEETAPAAPSSVVSSPVAPVPGSSSSAPAAYPSVSKPAHVPSAPAPYPSAGHNTTAVYEPTGVSTSTLTSTSTSTSSIVVTLTYGPPGSEKTVTTTYAVPVAEETVGSPVPTSVDSGSPGDVCLPATTVTTKLVEYITVTAGGDAPSDAETAPAYKASAPASTSAGAPVAKESKAEPSAPVYGGEPSSKQPVTTSATKSSAPKTTDAAEYSAVPVVPKSNVDKKPASTSTSSSSSSPSKAPSSGGSFSSKRGLAYNDPKLTEYFNSNIGWAYNWEADNKGLQADFPFIPELHLPNDMFLYQFDERVEAAVKNGAKYVFSFNEPDIASQANMSPGEAAANWHYVEKHADSAKLCAPAVSNGVGKDSANNDMPMGLDWLEEFFGQCKDCTISAINAHWYHASADAEDFKQYVTDVCDFATSKGISDVIIGEFKLEGVSDEEQSKFLEEVMPWMDTVDMVKGYAFFMVKEGSLVQGGKLSSIGETYVSA